MGNNNQAKAILAIGIIMLVSLLLISEAATAARLQSSRLAPFEAARLAAFTVQKVVVGNGTITIDPDKANYDAGEMITLTAKADMGWQFTGWTGAVNETTSPAHLTISGNHVVTGTFKQRCYALTLSHSGSGSDPVATPDRSSGCDVGSYFAGENISLSATPAIPWILSGWSGTINDLSLATTNSVQMPASTHNVSVIYDPICFPLSIGFTPQDSGQISPSPQPNCPIGAGYLAGTEVTLTAEPAPGYVFSHWSGSATGSVNPATVNMTAARSVTGHFVKACYPLVITHSGSGADPDATPTKSASCGPAEFVAGEVIALAGDPDPGWQVGGWQGTSDDDSSSENNVLVMPAMAGHVVSINYVKRPTLQFASANYTANETQGSVMVTVLRSGSLLEPVTVSYATTDGTADAGDDYTATAGMLSFGANVVSKTIDIPILDDIFDDKAEKFSISLSDPSDPAQLGTVTTAEITILDDEGEPTVQFSNADYSALEGNSAASLKVTLFPASTKTVFVEFETSPGTATPGVDYAQTSEIVRFLAGEIEQTVTVPLIDDSLDEPDESINLLLTTAFNADLGNAEAILTVEDDDDQPTVQFTSNEMYFTEGQPTALISITLSTASAYTVSVSYNVSDLEVGRLVNGSLVFEPGQTSQDIELDTSTTEVGDEWFLSLTGPQEATLGSPASARLYFLDKDRSQCHSLTLAHNGLGNAPVATNLPQSLGCPAGMYVASELINVLAQPDKGWYVNGWQGTINDATLGPQNVVRMPDGDHLVIANYITSVYLPGGFKRFATFYEGTEESEPNDTLSQATGPIKSGILYDGAFATSGDQDDNYFFVLDTPGVVEIHLSGIQPGHNYGLYLYDTVNPTNHKGYSNQHANNDEVITIFLDTLRPYYVRVHRDVGPIQDSDYQLEVVYP